MHHHQQQQQQHQQQPHQKNQILLLNPNLNCYYFNLKKTNLLSTKKELKQNHSHSFRINIDVYVLLLLNKFVLNLNYKNRNDDDAYYNDQDKDQNQRHTNQNTHNDDHILDLNNKQEHFLIQRWVISMKTATFKATNLTSNAFRQRRKRFSIYF